MSPASATYDASAAPTEQVARCPAAWSSSTSVPSLYVSPDGVRDHPGMCPTDVTIRPTTIGRRLRIDQSLGESPDALGAAGFPGIEHARDLLGASDAATFLNDLHRSALS